MRERPRIVTLIASATEIVCALGLRDQLIGVSHECDYPPDIGGLPVLSAPKVKAERPSGEIDLRVREILRDGLSVYRVRVSELERLRPDLIVTQDHCEVCAVSLRDVEDALCAIHLPGTDVCSLHPKDLGDVARDFMRVAEAAGVPKRGSALVERFAQRLDVLRAATAGARRPRVVCLEWLDPPMVAGGWMPELVRAAGGDPLIVDAPERFKAVTWEDVASAEPDLVVVFPCGFSIARTLEELANDQVARGLAGVSASTAGRCRVLDGNAYFNRPGPRLADSAELLAGLFHPGQFPDLATRSEAASVVWRG
jgi:iron complex transport system substrate-binding protein